MSVTKYVSEASLTRTLELLKNEMDNREVSVITDQEVADLFDIDDLEQEWVSQETIQQSLEDSEY
jgi:peroxiredoxin family protein